jgi:predicted ATP-grasp superfamily ATP-dependent carboligase
MISRRTVLLPDGESELALRVLRCLSQVPGLSVCALSREPRGPIRFSRHLAGFESHSVDEFDRERLDTIKAAAETFKADIILPVEIPSSKLLADHREEVERIAAVPPLSSSELFDGVSDKWRFAQFLERKEILHPKTVYVGHGESVEERLSELRFPILVKPRRASGGHGIRRFESLPAALQWASDRRDIDDMLFQEFIQGELIDCNILSKGGDILAHTIQRALVQGRSPYKPPAGFEFVDDERALAITEKVIRGLEYSGVANFDLIYDQERGEMKVLEMNPRYWMSLLGSLVAGVNFPGLSCLLSEGRPFTRPEYRHVRYVRPEASIGLLAGRYLGKSSPISSLDQTGLPFVFRDPLPELTIMFSRPTKTGFSP